MKLVELNKEVLCVVLCVAALSSCGEAEQPVIDILTPATAPPGQDLLDCPNPNIYDQWVGKWHEVEGTEIVEREYVFHADGTFEITYLAHVEVHELYREQFGFFAIDETEFVMAIRRPGIVSTNWEGTWLRSQDYLILRDWDDTERTSRIVVLKKV